MFIATRHELRIKLRMSRILLAAARVQRISYIWLLRSLRIIRKPATYGYFVPAGLAVLFAGSIIISSFVASNSALASPKVTSPEPQGSASDYSKFKHANPNHSRLPCLLCHRRESNASRPALPGSNGHLPCAGCHAQQFASSSGPMCTICHTGEQPGKLKAFPGLSSFSMKFDHARHLRMGSVSCASCHRPLRGGVALSVPAGFNAHNNCFSCHTPRATSGDRDISSCGVCHEPGRHVRLRQTAPAFRVGFSHAKHDKSEGLTCTECHRVRAGVPRRLQVSAPQPLNHHASPGTSSCMSCHNGKRAFGGDDFSVCQRCHTGTTWHFR
jgi:c(7)-type cytochrome triheme protein